MCGKVYYQLLIKLKHSIQLCRSYSFGVINWTKVELEEMDIRVRKEMTVNKAFNKHSDTDILYLPRNKGSKGLICIRGFCERMCVSTLGYVLQSKTIQGRTMKEDYMNKKEGTLLQKAENIVNSLELDVLSTTEGNILYDEQEISPKQLVRKVKKRTRKISSERTEKENCTWSILQKSRRARNRPRRVIWVVKWKRINIINRE